jgi:hypothetical protein
MSQGSRKIMPFKKEYKRSEETRQKISATVKKAMSSPDIRRRISEALKGKHPSLEARQKMSEAHKGKKRAPFSDETKRKMSIARKGIKQKPRSKEHQEKINKGRHMGWPKGQKRPPRSKEYCQKISMAHKGKRYSLESRRKMSEMRKGRRPSLETRKKMSIAKKGDKCSFWKGGITPAHIMIRGSSKYQQWRSQIFFRDDFTCQKCGQRGGKIEAHHIRPFKQLFEEVRRNLPLFNLFDGAMLYSPLWDINNGITLCQQCHGTTNRRLS